MPEIISNFFGRAKDDTPADEAVTATTVQTGDVPAADLAVAPETGDTTAIDAGQAGDIAEDTDTEDIADDTNTTAETGDIDADEPGSDPEDSDDTTSPDDAADEDDTDTDGRIADVDRESAEPVTVESADAPIAAETVAVDRPEPAATRPAAGVRGNTTLADAVVTKVVTAAAGKIDGVHSLDDNLSVDVADEVATITVSLVVEYGHPVKALAEQMRVAVIDAVEQILGLDVANVDVHVSDIHLTVD